MTHAFSVFVSYGVHFMQQKILKIGYSTEKIFNAFYARSIPIYFGDDIIDEYLNAKSFIQCKIKPSELKELRGLNRSEVYEVLESQVMKIVRNSLMPCVEEVKRVDKNRTLYYEMLRTPIFPNNNWHGTVIDPTVIGKKIRDSLKLHKSYLVDESEWVT